MEGNGKSTHAPKGGGAVGTPKAERPTETAKGKAQGNKKRKQGKARNGKEPSNDESDESDVYFYNDLQRWKNNVKVPIWLKKPKDKESINEFYKNVIKKLLRVKNKIRAYRIEEAYLIDCLRRCLIDLNLNSIRSLDYVNYKMVRRLCADDCSTILKNDGQDEENGKCFNRTKKQGDPADSKRDILHESILKEDNYADQITHIRVDSAPDKVTPLTAEDIKCLIDSLKNALSVEQRNKKKDLMRHVFNKVIIPGAFFENNNFCPIFMNLLKLDIYNACCLSGTEVSPKLMSLIRLLNNFDEGVADAGSTGEKQKGVPSASTAGTKQEDRQKDDSQQGDVKRGDSQRGDAQPLRSHHNESEDNSYRENCLFFQSQTSLFKLSQYCIEKRLVENHPVTSFDTIYIYNGKEPHSDANQSQCDSDKCKQKRKKLLPHANLKYSLDIQKKKNESLHFINEKKAILENDSTRWRITHRGGSHEEMNHPHAERQYEEGGSPVKEEVTEEVKEEVNRRNEDEAALANEKVASLKARESSCGRVVQENLSHSDKKKELQDGEIAPIEKEAISAEEEAISAEEEAISVGEEAISVQGSIKETEQSFDSAVRSVKGTSNFDYKGSHPKCHTEEGSKEDALNYLQNDWLEFDDDGGVAGRGELDEESLHGGDTNGCEAPRRETTPSTDTERCRLYKDNEPERGDQMDELRLEVAQSGTHNTERNTKLRKRKLSHSSHNSANETQSFQFDTFELFMDNGKIKKKKMLDGINEFEHVPIEGRNSTGKWHDSGCSDFTGAKVRVQLESREVGCGTEQWSGRDTDRESFANQGSSPLDGDNPLNRNDHITSSIEKSPTSARPPSGHSQAGQDSDTSVIIEMIHHDRKKDSDSEGGAVNPMEKFPPSITRPNCSTAVLSDFSTHKEGHPEEEDKNLRSGIGHLCDNASVSCVIDMNDYLKGDGAECLPLLPPKVASNSEVIVLEDDDEEGEEQRNDDNSGESSARDSHHSARKWEGMIEAVKHTPWMNPPTRRDEADGSISTQTPKKRETESKKELSILNIDINKMNNVVLEGLMEFFGLKSKRLSRKILITELTRIQRYLNEQYEQMAREYHPPIDMRKDHSKSRKGSKAPQIDYQTGSDTYRDREEGEKWRICTDRCSDGVSHPMGVPLGDVHAEVQRFFQDEKWFDGAFVGGGSASQVDITQRTSHQVSTTQGSPLPLNDDQAKSQEDYLNRMKKKIKQMELKALFERIDEAICVNEVLHDHIKRDRQIEYSLLKKYLLDCKLSVNREIVLSYCKEKEIQVVLKKKATV
ncbi:hypothetical protein C922_00791 [Plasmodium inui San Antonio 1]|uniref:Uncharacterized protein n=1 Tax=Plasmodium inui San Antonio 1 TaxID=1237626 RepID=W7AJT7_9APIC|nr:hypothetical protein C922_00791 [Plasmodium inui San Antonio 1]EUD69099.1 hypothetical protein C922_00791 [Plasmodium inui San Antonio 1]